MGRLGGTKLLLTEGSCLLSMPLRARELSPALLPANLQLENHASSIFHVLLLTTEAC